MFTLQLVTRPSTSLHPATSTAMHPNISTIVHHTALHPNPQYISPLSHQCSRGPKCKHRCPPTAHHPTHQYITPTRQIVRGRQSLISVFRKSWDRQKINVAGLIFENYPCPYSNFAILAHIFLMWGLCLSVGEKAQGVCFIKFQLSQEIFPLPRP